MALFIIARMQKEPTRSPVGKGLDKMWHIHTMEHYLAIKREEILIHDTTRVNLENTMLSESSTHTGVHTETTCNLWAV